MLEAFPGAPVYTSLYQPGATYPDFAHAEVHPGKLNRVGVLRRHHRLALPLLAPSYSSTRVEADVVLCSTSGWAHGVATNGRKVAYIYSPARWLYQTERYTGRGLSPARLAVAALGGSLRRWDGKAMASASRCLVISRAVSDQVRRLYRRDAEVLPPPPAFVPGGEERPVDGISPGYFLCVSRLLRYKNVDAVVAAAAEVPSSRLVVVGTGPEGRRL